MPEVRRVLAEPDLKVPVSRVLTMGGVQDSTSSRRFTMTLLGLIATLWMSRMLSALLFGVSPTDPLTYGVVGLMLALAAVVACWIPARAILRTNPASVLREEWEGRRVCDALTPPRS
ncbi:MAG: hypothetical protein IIC35_00315 [Gemmatimonadetes bacterium]|nr:hypothetical protein [Gemmatimonadota bacterium]